MKSRLECRVVGRCRFSERTLRMASWRQGFGVIWCGFGLIVVIIGSDCVLSTQVVLCSRKVS